MSSIQVEGKLQDDKREVFHSASLLSSERTPLVSSRVSEVSAWSAEKEVEALSKSENRRRWLSIYIIYFTMFLAAITFSVVLSSLWPFLLEIDYQHATASFLGWVVAAYSFGQLVASPLFGLWGDYRPTREPLLISLVINVIFSLLYSFAGAFPAGVAGWILIVARCMVGFGAGSTAVVRSYVSEATTKAERTGAMAGISASQALGFILGPALGLAFVPLGGKGYRINAIRLDFNMYTGPGYLSAFLGVANMVLLVFLFREIKVTRRYQVRSETRLRKVVAALPCSSESATSSAPDLSPPPRHFDCLAALVAIVLFFVILFVFSVFETIATPLSMDEFAWTKKQAVLYNDIFFVGLAVIAILTFLTVKFITKVVDERLVFIIALFVTAFGFFALLPMGNEFPEVAISTLLNNAKNLSANNMSAEVDLQNATTYEPVGCRVAIQPWCTHVAEVYIWQYAICLFLVAVGYPAASVLCYAIYSKILGPFPQGVMMGWLTAAGSLARSLGPIFVSFLYHQFGPLVTFSAVDGIVAVSILLLFVSRYRLVPYPDDY